MRVPLTLKRPQRSRHPNGFLGLGKPELALSPKEPK